MKKRAFYIGSISVALASISGAIAYKLHLKKKKEEEEEENIFEEFEGFEDFDFSDTEDETADEEADEKKSLIHRIKDKLVSFRRKSRLLA